VINQFAQGDSKMNFVQWVGVGCVTLVTIDCKCAQAGVAGEIVKQVGKAATRVVAGEVVELGVKSVTKQMVKKLGQESVEAVAKKGATKLLSKGGVIDDVAAAAWRNKGTLTGGVVLATVVANPKDSLAAGASILSTGINASASNIAGPIATEAAKGVGGAAWLLLAFGCLGMIAVKIYRRVRRAT
jgi:hypothetical protein